MSLTALTSTIRDEPGQPPDDPSPPERHPECPPETIFERRSGWRIVDLGELWRYRELLGFLVWRDVMVRYKQTILGASWALLQPLSMMLAFTVFFARMGRMSSGDRPYPLFALAGLLPWIFFSSALNASANSVVGSERLVSKIYFPRLLIPFSAAGPALVDFAISLGLMALMMAVYGVSPGPGLLLTPVVFGVLLLAALGLGTLLAALNVAYRDFKAIVPFAIQIWMFATPSIYMDVPDGSRAILWWNPIAGLIAAFRASLLGGPIPWGPLGMAAVASLVAFLVGCLYFRRTEQSFADLI